MKSRKSLPLRGCALIMAIFMMGAGLTGCKKTQEEASTDIPPAPKSTQTMTYSGKEPVGFQFELPAKGEEIAVLHTEKGDIRLRLFPDKAPNAVNNFKALIKVGYYDGITFHRVIDDFMIQGGDPTGTGSGGKSIWLAGRNYEFRGAYRVWPGLCRRYGCGGRHCRYGKHRGNRQDYPGRIGEIRGLIR